MGWFSRKPVTEATVSAPVAEPPDLEREGYEWGVSPHGQDRQQTQERRQMLEDLADLADQCVPVSACRTAISKAVTAAGLEIVPNDDVPEDEVPKVLPPEVQRLSNLLRFTNAREDMSSACAHHRALGWTNCPLLHVFEVCANLIRTLPAVPYDKTKVEDVDTHAEDHAVDALR